MTTVDPAAAARARAAAALTGRGICGCDHTRGQSCRACDGTHLDQGWAETRADHRAALQQRWEDGYRARHGHDYAIGGLPGCRVCRPHHHGRAGAA